MVEVTSKIKTREVSPVEVTQSALTRLAKVEPTLNAFVTTTPDLALRQAREAEHEIAQGHCTGSRWGART